MFFVILLLSPSFAVLKLIRVRMEVDNPRAYLLASLSLPPPSYVNCTTYKEFNATEGMILTDIPLPQSLNWLRSSWTISAFTTMQLTHFAPSSCGVEVTM